MSVVATTLDVAKLAAKLTALRIPKPTKAVIQAVEDEGQLLLLVDFSTLPEHVRVSGCLNAEDFPSDLRGVIPVHRSDLSLEEMEAAINNLNEYLLDTDWSLSFLRQSQAGRLMEQGVQNATHQNGLATAEVPMQLRVPRFSFAGVTSPVPLGAVLSEAILHNLVRECAL